jgi:protein disulfide-isomerase
MMIRKLFFSCLVLICFSANSQVLNWNKDVVDAIAISNKERKPMLLLFTNSDLERGALDAQIFNTLDFALWARDNVILVKIDLSDDVSNEFLERNLSLRKAFAVKELPAICYSKATIRKDKINYQLIGKTGFKPGGVKSWIADSIQILKGPVEE